jgi:hypothetical protein
MLRHVVSYERRVNKEIKDSYIQLKKKGKSSTSSDGWSIFTERALEEYQNMFLHIGWKD